MGADGALLDDVIAALAAVPDVRIVRLPGNVIEVAKPGELLRTFPLKATVSRRLLTEFERYYGVPMAAFYPPVSSHAKKHAG